MTTVDHDHFEQAYEAVKSGKANFVIPTAYNDIIIHRRVLLQWEKIGKPIIRKSNDSQGYYLRQGKREVYVIAGLLKIIKAWEEE